MTGTELYKSLINSSVESINRQFSPQIRCILPLRILTLLFPLSLPLTTFQFSKNSDVTFAARVSSVEGCFPDHGKQSTLLCRIAGPIGNAQ